MDELRDVPMQREDCNDRLRRERTGLPNSPGWRRRAIQQIVKDTFAELRANINRVTYLTAKDKKLLGDLLGVREEKELAKVDVQQGLWEQYQGE